MVRPVSNAEVGKEVRDQRRSKKITGGGHLGKPSRRTTEKILNSSTLKALGIRKES